MPCAENKIFYQEKDFMHTFESLTADLRNAGIVPEDTLLVHSSMKSIGEVEGGADTVLDVFMNYLKSDGLAVFPTLSYRLNTENPRFDVRLTESQVGILPELFRQRPGVIRSLHPTHSLAAYGKDAAEFTAGHEKFDSPGAEYSPWWRLYERGGKILFLGTGINCNTYLHAVEEWLPVPGSLSEAKQPLEVVDYDGNVIAVPSRRHQGGHSRFYHRLEKLYRDNGAMIDVKFGDAQCVLADCRKLADLTLGALAKEPFIFTEGYQA